MTLRTIVRAGLFIIIAIAGLSYLSYLRSGSFWIPGFVTKSLEDIGVEKSTMAPVRLDQPAYKWLEKGKWVYGDNPPPGVEAIAIHDTSE